MQGQPDRVTQELLDFEEEVEQTREALSRENALRNRIHKMECFNALVQQVSNNKKYYVKNHPDDEIIKMLEKRGIVCGCHYTKFGKIACMRNFIELKKKEK
jgi:hypothetical protein